MEGLAHLLPCSYPAMVGGPLLTVDLQCNPNPPTPACLQLPLLDKAAHRLLNDAGFEVLRKEMDAFRSENNWVEDSALFRWAAFVVWTHKGPRQSSLAAVLLMPCDAEPPCPPQLQCAH